MPVGTSGVRTGLSFSEVPPTHRPTNPQPPTPTHLVVVGGVRPAGFFPPVPDLNMYLRFTEQCFGNGAFALSYSCCSPPWPSRCDRTQKRKLCTAQSSIKRHPHITFSHEGGKKEVYRAVAGGKRLQKGWRAEGSGQLRFGELTHHVVTR